MRVRSSVHVMPIAPSPSSTRLTDLLRIGAVCALGLCFFLAVVSATDERYWTPALPLTLVWVAAWWQLLVGPARSRAE